jgi:integrase
LKPPAKNTSRERALDESELTEVWRVSADLGYPAAAFLQCLILTGQRRGEVAGMRWRDVDLEKALWTIPAEFMKSGRVHVVPLSAPVVSLLKGDRFPRFTKGDYIFTTTSGEKAINGFSKFKQHIDGKTLEQRKKLKINKDNIPDWTLHDIRRTMTTWMAKSGVLPHVLSAVLGHSAAASVSVMPSAAVTRVYNRYAYLDEKRAALEAWAQFVLSLQKPAPKAARA